MEFPCRIDEGYCIADLSKNISGSIENRIAVEQSADAYKAKPNKKNDAERNPNIE
jgi:hypothetical protein